MLGKDFNMQERKTLGVGLGAILGISSPLSKDTGESLREMKTLLAHKLVPGKYQPRREFNDESLRELADSIAAKGILQPIIARKTPGQQFEIIAGERRWRAAQMAGLQSVPVIIAEMSDEDALAFGLIENIQRQDLSPIEEATALSRLIEEFGMTHQQLAKSVGKSRTAISNSLRLLKASPLIQSYLCEGKLEVGHARSLLTLSSQEQEEMALIIIDKKMTARDVERLVKSKKTGCERNNKKENHERCSEWESALEEVIPSRVTVKVNEGGIGKVVIETRSIRQTEEIVSIITERVLHGST